MSKHWTEREDQFLHSYFDAVGDYAGTHDLGRPKGAAVKRVKRLRESGAWAAMDRMRDARRDYRLCLSLPTMEHEEAADRGEYVPLPAARVHYRIRVEATKGGPYSWDRTEHQTAEKALHSWDLESIRRRNCPEACRIIAVEVTERDVAGIEQMPPTASEVPA